MKYILTLLFTLSALSIFAQLPTTNIYVFDMEASAIRDVYRFTKPKLINGNNLNGYNNQPQFVRGQLYITSQRDGKQTDIYRFNIDRRMQTRITATASYRRALTRDWTLATGYTHRLNREEGAGTARSNTLFVTLQRDFAWRP